MTITTLRPSVTASATGWSVVPSGTAHGVTSDDSDSTYVLWSGTGTALVVNTPVDAPPAGERRHQVRLRARGEDGDAWWAVRQSSGALVAGASAQFPSSPATVTGSWGTGVPADGSIVLGCYVDGQSTGVKITELYLDVDSREAPTFTPQTVDGSGAATTTISDTATPTIRVSALDTDGLAARQYRYRVYSIGESRTVWDTGIVSGVPADRLTSPLVNGSYVAYYQVWTTLGSSTAYSSVVEEVAFTVAVNLLPRPVAPTATPVPDSPFYSIEVCAPYVNDLDGDVGYIQIQRADCVTDGEPASVTTIAMVGPLETDECGTWTDYSIPRTGLGGDCEHEPEQCCSYYRARTIGRMNGSIVISNWSDVTDSGVPVGMIVMWPGTAGSIPTGWVRETDLDGRYLKGIATAGTQPGVTGGAATHTHTVTPHVHDTSHAHNMSGTTSAAVGSTTVNSNATPTTGTLATHTHSYGGNLATATVNSDTATPAIGSSANDPARIEQIWISSDGTPAGVPDLATAFMPDIIPAGWTSYTAASDRFIKGAPAAGDGGTTAASALPSHTHTIGAHTHAGISHTHTSPNTGSAAGTNGTFAGATPIHWVSSHNHPVTATNADTAALASGGSGSSDAASPSDPPYRNVRMNQNTSGGASLPIGLIAAWRQSIGSIPENWQVCDGTNGTPDLLNRYPRAATTSLGGAGGSPAAHSHSSPAHTHTTASHGHAITVGASASTGSTNASVTSPAVTLSNVAHTHTSSNSASTTPTVGNASAGALQDTTTEPPFETVAFVQMISEPEPVPDPEMVCFTWDEDQHLIRTRDAAGPIWAPVNGRFVWDVERPFTSNIGVSGTRFVTSAEPGGRNLRMTAAVESEAELAALRAVLARPLVLVSPSDSTETWAAPVAESVVIVKVGRIRQVTADFIATGPEPEPQVADV